MIRWTLRLLERVVNANPLATLVASAALVVIGLTLIIWPWLPWAGGARAPAGALPALQELAALLVIAVQMVAFICRLDWLSWRNSRPGPVAFHLLCLIYLVAAMAHVLQGEAIGLAWLGASVTGLWLLESWRTWRNGPPQHVMTRPMPLYDNPCRPRRVWSEP